MGRQPTRRKKGGTAKTTIAKLLQQYRAYVISSHPIKMNLSESDLINFCEEKERKAEPFDVRQQ